MIKKTYNDDNNDYVSHEDGDVDEDDDNKEEDDEDDDDQVHLVESSGSLTECPGPRRPSSGLEKRHII